MNKSVLLKQSIKRYQMLINRKVIFALKTNIAAKIHVEYSDLPENVFWALGLISFEISYYIVSKYQTYSIVGLVISPWSDAVLDQARVRPTPVRRTYSQRTVRPEVSRRAHAAFGLGTTTTSRAQRWWNARSLRPQTTTPRDSLLARRVLS